MLSTSRPDDEVLSVEQGLSVKQGLGIDAEDSPVEAHIKTPSLPSSQRTFTAEHKNDSRGPLKQAVCFWPSDWLVKWGSA